MSPPRWRGRPGDNSETAPNHQFAPGQGAIGSLSLQADEPEALDQALPDRWETLLLDGIPEKDRPDARRVWNTFVSIAMSAQRRKWSRIRFIDTVTGQQRLKVHGSKRWHTNGLWRQMDEFSRDTSRAYRSLDSAWTMATLNLANAVDRTLADLHADAVELAWLWEERVASGVDDLSKGEMGVMDYLVVWTERRGRPDVTCPIRKVAAHAGIAPSHAHRLLAQLTRKGLLIKHSSGWSKTHKKRDGTTTHRGQAAIYALALITALPAKGDLVKSPRMSKSPAGGRAEGDTSKSRD